MIERGVLYICPTPIGNLDDMTIRGLKVLEGVDLIAAEDTRRSLQLLNHFEIKKTLTSYHEHNVREKGPVLVEKLQAGKSIALVSDAGMPGISDPGEDLIKLCIEAGLRVEVLPGATASIVALVGSGLDTRRFAFEGFLPSNKKDKKERLEEIEVERKTMIIYESPYRVKDSLETMLEVFGNRQVAVSRELTKRYEETLRGSLEEVLEELTPDKIRGEFVIVIEGNQEEIVEEEIDIEGELEKCLEAGMSKSQSVKFVAKTFDLPKNEVYDVSLRL